MKYLIFLALTLSAMLANAELVEVHNVNIGRLGSHNGNVFYMNLKNGFKKDGKSYQCKWDLAYCKNEENNSCQNLYGLALMAKAQNKPLADFRFNFDSDTSYCSIWLVAVD